MANRAAIEREIEIPLTLERALDPEWLSLALGREVTAARQVEMFKTVATKVRFVATFASGEEEALCLKGLLDVDDASRMGGPTCVLEGDFYSKVAPAIDIQVPECLVAAVDRAGQQGVIIMRDVVAAGGKFCSALDPFTADDAASSLEQIVRLHQGSAFLQGADWIRPRAAELAQITYITPAMLQELLDGPRGEGFSPQVRSGARLIAGLRALAARDQQRSQFLVHGDSHAGNIFRTAKGAGLIDWQLLQRGGWALDVAYHLCAVLPVETAEREERRLLGLYLGMMRSAGFAMPDDDEAWQQYREAVVYGYFLWGITRRVDPPIIVQFVQRLGSAVARHDSFNLLDVPF